MEEFQMTILWVGAFRYHLGRMTYAVSDFCNLLIETWPTLPEHTRNLIRRDLEEEFKRDNEARTEGWPYRPLGDDCDRREWARVRALWVETKLMEN